MRRWDRQSPSVKAGGSCWASANGRNPQTGDLVLGVPSIALFVGSHTLSSALSSRYSILSLSVPSRVCTDLMSARAFSRERIAIFWASVMFGLFKKLIPRRKPKPNDGAVRAVPP